MGAPVQLLRGLASVMIPTDETQRVGNRFPGSRDLYMDRGSLPNAPLEIVNAPTANAPSAAPTTETPENISDLIGPLSDHSWLMFGSAAARNGLTALTGVAGYPDPYQISGNTVILDKLRGVPYILGGFATSLTKCRGGAIKGSMSYGKQYCYFPGHVGLGGANSDSLRDKLCSQDMGIPFNPGETLTGYHDNVNTNEVGFLALLMTYGAPWHPYPRSLAEVCRYSGIVPKSIWFPETDVSIAATLTNGSGAAVLSTATQETLEWDADSKYYVIGLRHIPGSADGIQMIQFRSNLAKSWAMRNAYIPVGSAIIAGTTDGEPWTFPYEAIGPFKGDATPSISGYGTVIAALKMTMALVKV